MPVGNHLPHGETAQGGPLKRELGERHIRLMALGACIGVGLFLGSAKAIEMAGPAIMLSNRFIFCLPLLFLSSIFLCIKVFSNESALHVRWPEF